MASTSRVVQNIDLQPIFEWPLAYSAQPPAVRVPTDAALRTRQQGVASQAARAGVDVPCVAVLPLFDGYQLHEGQDWDWVFMNLALDPLLYDPDGFPIPDKNLERLQLIRQAGLRFDALYIAHEVRKGSVREGDQITAELLAPPPPKAVQDMSDNLGTLSRLLWRAAVAPIAAAGVVAAAIPAVLGAVAVAGADPSLVGAVVGAGRPMEPGEPAAWFYLTHWGFNQKGQ